MDVLQTFKDTFVLDVHHRLTLTPTTADHEPPQRQTGSGAICQRTTVVLFLLLVHLWTWGSTAGGPGGEERGGDTFKVQRSRRSAPQLHPFTLQTFGSGTGNDVAGGF